MKFQTIHCLQQAPDGFTLTKADNHLGFPLCIKDIFSQSQESCIGFFIIYTAFRFRTYPTCAHASFKKGYTIASINSLKKIKCLLIFINVVPFNLKLTVSIKC